MRISILFFVRVLRIRMVQSRTGAMYHYGKEFLIMKETYEALKMEVIAFDGEIWTARADDGIVVSGEPNALYPGN